MSENSEDSILDRIWTQQRAFRGLQKTIGIMVILIITGLWLSFVFHKYQMDRAGVIKDGRAATERLAYKISDTMLRLGAKVTLAKFKPVNLAGSKEFLRPVGAESQKTLMKNEFVCGDRGFSGSRYTMKSASGKLIPPRAFGLLEFPSPLSPILVSAPTNKIDHSIVYFGSKDKICFAHISHTWLSSILVTSKDATHVATSALIARKMALFSHEESATEKIFFSKPVASANALLIGPKEITGILEKYATGSMRFFRLQSGGTPFKFPEGLGVSSVKHTNLKVVYRWMPHLDIFSSLSPSFWTIALIPIVFLLIFGYIRLISMRLYRPLTLIAQHLDQMREGTHEGEPLPASGVPEWDRLSRGLNQVVGTLKEYQDASQKKLEISLLVMSSSLKVKELLNQALHDFDLEARQETEVQTALILSDELKTPYLTVDPNCHHLSIKRSCLFHGVSSKKDLVHVYCPAPLEIGNTITTFLGLLWARVNLAEWRNFILFLNKYISDGGFGKIPEFSGISVCVLDSEGELLFSDGQCEWSLNRKGDVVRAKVGNPTEGFFLNMKAHTQPMFDVNSRELSAAQIKLDGIQ